MAYTTVTARLKDEANEKYVVPRESAGTVDRNTGDTVYQWRGTLAQWEAGRLNGTIPDSWNCFITDDQVNSSAIPLRATSDFNLFAPEYMYSIVHTDRGITLNAPLNVTAYWMVTYMVCGSMKMQIARKMDDPACERCRSYVNGAWTDWKYTYAHFYTGGGAN